MINQVKSFSNAALYANARQTERSQSVRNINTSMQKTDQIPFKCNNKSDTSSHSGGWMASSVFLAGLLIVNTLLSYVSSLKNSAEQRRLVETVFRVAEEVTKLEQDETIEFGAINQDGHREIIIGNKRFNIDDNTITITEDGRTYTSPIVDTANEKADQKKAENKNSK